MGLNIFPVLLGLIDGMLTALTLTAGKLLQPGEKIGFDLCWRVAVASAASGSFVFFVAKYAELRAGLIRAERELSLGSSQVSVFSTASKTSVPRHLAATALGRKVVYRSLWEAVITGLSGLIGSFVPLAVAIVDPIQPWITFGFSVVVLALFGYFLGRSVGRRPKIWSALLVLGGVIIIAIGVKLDIVS